MNKYEKALKRLKQETAPTTYCADFNKEECINALQELVDKAAPKKRVYVDTTPSISSHFICPVCRTKVSPISLYCDTCGQRLE